MTDFIQHTAYSIKDLRFSYKNASGSLKEEATLDIPSLDIERGKITVLRGHNGSGKTTLMKLLCGLLESAEGAVKNPAGLHAVLVQQEPYLFHGTVHQNLAAPLRFLKRGIREDLINKNLNLVGLEGFGKRKARELSGGERKRVAIARALTAEPDVLFLDEPDANVDVQTSAELEKLILDLKRQGMTLILCSHHKGFAYRTADRLIDLYRGSYIPHSENIFKGEYSYTDGELHSTFISGDRTFRCPGRQGSYSTMVVPPENIALSRKPSEKDNRLEGVLQSMEAFKEGRFDLALDCGDVTIKARLSGTEISLHKYRIGETLNILFSPSALHLY